MIDLGEEDFRRLAGTADVAAIIASAETDLASARRFYRLYVTLGLVLSAILFLWIGLAWGWLAAVIVGVIGPIATFVIASIPFARASDNLKGPVLDALCSAHGLTWCGDEFDPPVYALARPHLFGDANSHYFRDLIWGETEAGHRFAVYEARISKRQGKNGSKTIVDGTVYALQRPDGASGTVIAVPDHGWFNLFNDSGGLGKVSLDDPDFDSAFEVYASSQGDAGLLTGHADLRALLLEFKQAGPCFLYAGSGDIFIATTAADRFEPGSVLSGMGADRRARAVFDDVAATMRAVGRIDRALG